MSDDSIWSQEVTFEQLFEGSYEMPTPSPDTTFLPRIPPANHKASKNRDSGIGPETISSDPFPTWTIPTDKAENIQESLDEVFESFLCFPPTAANHTQSITKRQHATKFRDATNQRSHSYQCSHCNSSDSPKWRLNPFDKNLHWCNSCRVYYNNLKRLRPVSRNVTEIFTPK